MAIRTSEAVRNSEGVNIMKVDGDEMKKEFRWLREMLESVFGPWGVHLILQPQKGGAITRTRHTHQLLGLLKTPYPLLKLMISHLQAHSQCYKDSTLYAGILATNLITESLELSFPRRSVSLAVCDALSELCGVLCRHGNNSITQPVDLSSASSLLHFLSSSMSPKLSHLPETTIRHLSSLIFQGVLRAVPSTASAEPSQTSISGCVSFLPLPRATSGQSKLFEGVLLSREVWHSSHMLSGDKLRRDRDGLIRTLLFTSSLAGDEEGGVWLGREEGQLEGVASLSVDKTVRDVLLDIGRDLLQKGVGLLICQKVVHPCLKDYLLQQNVLVLERVSGGRVPSVHAVCGGSIISSTSSQALANAKVGVVKDVKNITYLDSKFVQLLGVSESHSTLLVCGRSQESAGEVEVVCRDTLVLCERCLGDPVVVGGAGCMDTQAAHLLITNAQGEEGVASLPLGKRVLEMMAKCFQRQALALYKRAGLTVLTDSTHHHCWTIPLGMAMEDVVGREEQNEGSGRVGCGETWEGHQVPRPLCCCGGVAMASLPQSTTWHLLTSNSHSPCSQLPTTLQSSTSSSSSSLSASNHSTIIGAFTIADLLTPRLAALQCAAELTQTVLSTAFTINCRQ